MSFFAPRTRPSNPPDDDRALAARAAAGDAAALAEAYRREAGPVYRYALALCGNASWAADATQEAFVALAVGPATYDAGRGPLGAWLAGVARHALAARWRNAAHERSWGEVDPVDFDGASDDDASRGDDAVATALGASPEALLVRAQTHELLWAALRRLPAVFREALVLVDLQERPYAEAAQIAGIELNTLRTRVHRARAKLAALLCAAPGSP